MPQYCSHHQAGRARLGLTLVELLIVVTILILLVGVTLPMMQPLLEGREIREAARQIDAYMARAKSRAMTLGRPVGVLFTPQEANRSAAFQISIVEVPLPYAGDSTASRAEIVASTNNVWTAKLSGTAFTRPDLIRVGDLIKFDYRGPLYPVQTFAPTPSGVATLTFGLERVDKFAREPIPPPQITKPQPNVALAGVPFQVFRQPRRTSAAPLELPAPAAVDLSLSGTGLRDAGTFDFFVQDAASGGFAITFAPSGQVDTVYLSLGLGPQKFRPMGTIFLMVGKTNQVGQVTDDQTPVNLQDPHNLWISIAHRTGQVTINPNNVVWQPGQGLSLPEKLALSRELATSGQSMGG